jgi:hypothetical protein
MYSDQIMQQRTAQNTQKSEYENKINVQDETIINLHKQLSDVKE